MKMTIELLQRLCAQKLLVLPEQSKWQLETFFRQGHRPHDRLLSIQVETTAIPEPAGHHRALKDSLSSISSKLASLARSNIGLSMKAAAWPK